MRHTTIINSALVALLPLAATAQDWQVIDNFEDGADDWTIFAQMDDAAEIIVQPDPTGSDKGNVFYVESYGYGENWGDTHVGATLPFAIEFGETATLYWEAYMSGVSNNWHVGVTDLDAPTTWSHAWWTTRFSFETDPQGSVQGHDGSTYIYLSPDGTGNGIWPAIDQWHKFWAVFTVSENPADPEVAASKWSIYWQSPDDATPQGPLVWLKEGNPSEGGFRRVAEGPADTIWIATNAGNPTGNYSAGDPWFMDNFFIALGDHGGVDPLDDTPNYGPYPIDSGWINSTNLGWLYVGNGTELNGWVYSDASAGMNLGWVYMHPDNMSSTGDWVYIPR